MKRKVKAKVTGTFTNIAVVIIDDDDYVDEYIETQDELEFSDVEVLSILTDLT